MNGINEEFPYWIIAYSIGKKYSEKEYGTMGEVTLSLASMMASNIYDTVKVYLVIGTERFEFDPNTAKIENNGFEFDVIWVGCDEPIHFADINKALDAIPRIAKKTGGWVNLKATKLPKKPNKPNRDTVISQDDITNLKILLETETDFNEFLNKI